MTAPRQGSLAFTDARARYLVFKGTVERGRFSVFEEALAERNRLRAAEGGDRSVWSIKILWAPKKAAPTKPLARPA